MAFNWHVRKNKQHYILVGLFILYMGIVIFGLLYHELWGDELHSWNISKGSTSYANLIYNRRYEGHPPAWYTVLWLFSKFSHHLIYLKLAQLLFITGAIYVFIFYAPFPAFIKALSVFGYYFVFEYALFSRNYAIGLLPCFLLCTIDGKNFRGKWLVYYFLLFWLSNTHLLALALAASMHLYSLISLYEQKKKINKILVHTLLGAVVLLPSFYFIFPPSGSSLSLGFFLQRWHIGQLAVVAQTPLRSFMPIPAWWEPHFWNTQFLTSLIPQVHAIKYLCPLLSAAIVTIVFYILSGSRKATALFGSNLLLSAIIGCIFPLNTARYVGYIFIGFVVAYWLYCRERPVSSGKMKMVVVLLLFQVVAGTGSFILCQSRPFSRLGEVKTLAQQVPAGERLVTDNWALNALSAYMDSSFYCVDLRQTRSYLLWDNRMKELGEDPYRYYNGVRYLFDRENIHRVYMISTHDPAILNKLDARFLVDFQVTLKSEFTGGIANSDDVYLYLIKEK